jgi:hypothetical protein
MYMLACIVAHAFAMTCDWLHLCACIRGGGRPLAGPPRVALRPGVPNKGAAGSRAEEAYL